MKKLTVLLWIFALLLSASSCSIPSGRHIVTRQDKVLASIGEYENKQFWRHGWFQDFTDFGIYTFASANLEDNPYFSVVTEEDIVTIDGYIAHFEKCIDSLKTKDPADKLVLHYAFDHSIIDTGDFFYIYKDDHFFQYSDYDLWFFDVQTNTLYYFHYNI